ncbi:MAG: HipA domain-containing protein [Planctomycetota bacterium]|nr:HipA domain-containing protein [Planctomycetota bacterium]
MIDYDPKTLRAMFGKPIRPVIPISLSEVAAAARQLAGKLSISGVQPKLSLALEGETLVPVERDGLFILKPQTQEFPELPQNEYLCMQMGLRLGLNTAPCLLLALADGSPAYLVKRFDRRKDARRVAKLPCEDMQQILGGRDKYDGSHEQIARAIREHCTYPPLELQRLFELVLFHFAIGNGDAHKKNFSLLTAPDGTIALSPAYDLVSSRLVLPSEADELTLTLQGKRNALTRADFLAFAAHLAISPTYAHNRLADLLALRDVFGQMIATSALSANLRASLADILAERLARLAG